jgi:trehalose 6-phosphate synthase
MVEGRLVCQRTDGGLSASLDPVLSRLGGTWIAWGSGENDRDVIGQADGVLMPPDAKSYRLRRVWLHPYEVRGGSFGYANQVLWPLCHVTLDRVAYRKSFWSDYIAMNRRFAATVLDELQKRPGIVWAHDFHLALLPAMIKSEAPSTPVSLFWHVPWPGPDVFRILPERREVLEGLLAADCLTFQTSASLSAFADCAREFLSASVDPARRAVDYRERRTRLTARAISVDVELCSALARTGEVANIMGRAQRRLDVPRGVKVGLGVDRLDYTKGLLKRLWALDDFYGRYPEYRGRFTFLQVAIPTRGEVEAYRRYREVISQTVAEINERIGTGPSLPEGWKPIEYIEGRISRYTLAAYFRMADLAIVSSVYDGMNLVAKEFVASQVDERGVLLLSHMAGAADEMASALMINPYDREGLADAIKQALEMPEEEKRRRIRTMREYLARHDIHAWTDECLRDVLAERESLQPTVG